MISQFLMFFPSIANRTRVLTFCHPCLPAAPGLICKQFIFSSYMILRMCECPQMNSRGLWINNSFFVSILYLGGYPPICLINTFTSSQLKTSCSPNSRRISGPSIFPKTPFNGFNDLSLFAISMKPKSPACHISSQFPKCLKTFSSRKPCVSDMRPIFFNEWQR